LTFDDVPERVTLAHKPIVADTEGNLYVVPRLILLLNIPHTFVRALTLSAEGQAAYSRIINTIESAGVASIARGLSDGMFADAQIAVQRDFRLHDVGVITPDVVILSADRRELLVIDVKYAAPPFGPADVAQDLSEMRKWKAAMDRYIGAFHSQPEIVGQHFAIDSTQPAVVYGLIVLRWPFPVPVEFDGQMGAIDWPSLHQHLRETHGTVSELLNWVRNRPDVPVPQKLTWTPKDVRVGDWTYRYSVLVGAPG